MLSPLPFMHHTDGGNEMGGLSSCVATCVQTHIQFLSLLFFFFSLSLFLWLPFPVVCASGCVQYPDFFCCMEFPMP